VHSKRALLITAGAPAQGGSSTPPAAGVLLFSCLGRGRALFNEANYDSRMAHISTGVPVAGTKACGREAERCACSLWEGGGEVRLLAVGGRRRGALARCGREAERCAREQARGRRRGARASKQENACHRKRDELCRSARETADEGRRRVGHGRGSAECRVNTVDAGVFCNGEIGPVHGSSRLLGFTSVFTLLRQKTAAPAAETSG